MEIFEMITVCKLWVLNRDTWNCINVGKLIIIIKQEYLVGWLGFTAYHPM